MSDHMKKVNVTLEFSRPTRSNGEPGKEPFTLKIKDKNSNLPLFEVDIPIAAFADLISSRITGSILPALYSTHSGIGKYLQRETFKIRFGGIIDKDEIFDRSVEYVAKYRPGWVVMDKGYHWTRHEEKDGRSLYSLRIHTFTDEEFPKEPIKGNVPDVKD
jgi:hypothetical protein